MLWKPVPSFPDVESPGLNLGCGAWMFHGWVNADVLSLWPRLDPPQVRCDAASPLPFRSGHFATAYLGNVLEHLYVSRHLSALCEIARVLRPEGICVVSVPNMTEVFEQLTKHPDDRRLLQLVWGQQGADRGPAYEIADTHRWGFTYHSLADLLKRTGFGDVWPVRFHSEEVWWDLSVAARKAS